MLPKEKYENALELYSSGRPIYEISKLLEINRSTISSWFNRRKPEKLEKNNSICVTDLVYDVETRKLYSFLFGLYLGDGYIYEGKRTTHLTFSLDKKYDILNQIIINNITSLFGKVPYVCDRSVNRGQKFLSNSIDVKYFSKNITMFFPQHGRGPKHNRVIELSEWQKQIIIPEKIIQGLFFSDGCYSYNSRDQYYFYSFSNMSKDIISILIKYLSDIGVDVKMPNKNVNGAYVLSCYGDNARKLEKIIGTKYSPII